MDIASGEGWLKIFSSTYIMNMCERWLEYPIAEYDYVGTPNVLVKGILAPIPRARRAASKGM